MDFPRVQAQRFAGALIPVAIDGAAPAAESAVSVAPKAVATTVMHKYHMRSTSANFMAGHINHFSTSATVWGSQATNLTGAGGSQERPSSACF